MVVSWVRVSARTHFILGVFTEFVMSVPVVIDADNLVKRCVMATAKADLAAGVWTGGIYNSLTMLSSILSLPEIFAGEIYAAFDDGVPAYRYALVPGYREARVKRTGVLTESQKERAYRQVDEVRAIFRTLGVVCVSSPRNEGDDIVAALCRGLIDDYGMRPIVLSSDKDLWQLTATGVRVWEFGKDRLVDADVLWEEVGVRASEYLLYRTLVGDTSDSVPGAGGCGPVKAQALIERWRRSLRYRTPDEQLLVLSQKLQGMMKTGDKLYAYERWIAENYSSLCDSMCVINLSIAPDDAAQAVVNEALGIAVQVDQRAFLQLCKQKGLRGVLASPMRFLRPFQKAERRRSG